MMMHVCKLESSPKDIAQNKSLFIYFIRLHIVQHITIVSIECLHLPTMVPNFFYGIQQLLPIPSGGEEALMECLRLFKYLVSFADGLVDLLDHVLDVELSGRHYAFQPSLSSHRSAKVFSYYTVCLMLYSWSSTM